MPLAAWHKGAVAKFSLVCFETMRFKIGNAAGYFPDKTLKVT